MAQNANPLAVGQTVRLRRSILGHRKNNAGDFVPHIYPAGTVVDIEHAIPHMLQTTPTSLSPQIQDGFEYSLVKHAVDTTRRTTYTKGDQIHANATIPHGILAYSRKGPTLPATRFPSNVTAFLLQDYKCPTREGFIQKQFIAGDPVHITGVANHDELAKGSLPYPDGVLYHFQNAVKNPRPQGSVMWKSDHYHSTLAFNVGPIAV